MAENNFANLTAALEEYGAAYRDLYKAKLQQPDANGNTKVASGTLLDSVSYRVEADGTVFEVVLSLMDYWKYIETGRRAGAAPPPYEAILSWVRVKPVLPRPSDKGKLPTPEQLAQKIRWSIHRKGIPAKPLMFETSQEINAHYRPIIAAAFAADTMQLLNLRAIDGGLKR